MNIDFIFTLVFIIVGGLLYVSLLFGLLFSGHVKSSFVVMALGLVITYFVLGDNETMTNIESTIMSMIRDSIYLLLVALLLFIIIEHFKSRRNRKKRECIFERDFSRINADLEKAESKLLLLKSDNWLEYFKSNTGFLTITENEYGRRKERVIAIENVDTEISILNMRMKLLKANANK